MNEPQVFCYPVLEIMSVYDGDTLTVRADLGFGLIKHKLKIRIFGIDTPEIRGSGPEEKALAKQARDYLRELLESATDVTFHSVSKPDKYGRCLARLWADGASVEQHMLETEFARPYAGGTKQPWV